MTPADRVAADAALLDEGVPGWPARIDLDVLDMLHQNRCVFGQVFGRYAFAPFDSRENVAHGFKAADEADVVALDAEWRRVVAERLVAA